MEHHTPSKTDAKSMPVFFPPCLSTLQCCVASMDMIPLLGCFVYWCINLTHAPTDGLRGMSTHTWMIGAHGTSHIIQGKSKKCASFHPSTHGTSLECCLASMDVIHLFGCLYNSVSTPYMHSLMNSEGCQHLYGWLEIMVHNTLSKAEDESAPVFIHLHMEHPLSVVCPVCM